MTSNLRRIATALGSAAALLACVPPAAAQGALGDPALQSKAYELGLVLESKPTPQGLRDFLRAELDKWKRVAVATNMKAE